MLAAKSAKTQSVKEAEANRAADEKRKENKENERILVYVR